MDFGIGTYALGYAAGALSTLSPCVLPLLPILFTSALSGHRHGPLALAAGLSLSFTAVGLFLATVGLALGIDAEWLRRMAAAAMIAVGILLVSRRLQQAFSAATARLGSAGDALLDRLSHTHWAGPFVLGLALGVVWAPCVGPTLGAALALAAQSTQLAAVALLMLVFGLGASTPLLVLGSLSRAAFARVRAGVLGAAGVGRRVLGGLLVLLGIAVASGLERRASAWLIANAPDWLLALSTRW